MHNSKISCPQAVKVLYRNRLFHMLDETRQEAKIIWIAAPGGSGKTTLASSYLQKKQISHCWYQIDKDENDLASFFHYLGQAAKLAAPRRKKAMPQFLPEYQMGLPAFTRHFLKEVSSRLNNNGVIVLDDFHLVPEDGAIVALLDIIASVLLPGVTVIVLSRKMPSDELVPLIARRQLVTISPQEMSFSLEEWIAAGKLLRSSQSEAQLESIHNKFGGWIAGLMLLPDAEIDLENANTSRLGLDLLDNYIANQFLQSIDDESQQTLYKLCFLPHISENAALALSNNKNAVQQLLKLAYNNLFVIQQGQKGFTLHPLMKEYLSYSLRKEVSPDKIYQLQMASAKVLLSEGEYESAAEILLEISAWEALSQLIIENAAELYDTGRVVSLMSYINALPEECILQEPWLQFWLGRLSIFRDAASAFKHFDHAYNLFYKNNNCLGSYLTWHVVMSIICSTLQGGKYLLDWLHRYDDLQNRWPEIPESLQGGQVEAVLLLGYFFSGENPAKRKALLKELGNLIQKTNHPALRLKLMSSYVIVTCVSGIQEKDMVIIQDFEKQLETMQTDPVAYLASTTYGALAAWAYNDFEKLYRLETYAWDIAQEHGVSIFDPHIQSQLVLAALGQKNYELAKKHIKVLQSNVLKNDVIYESLYLTCIMTAGCEITEYQNLDDLSRQFLKTLPDIGFPSFVFHTYLLYVYYLIARNKIEYALDLHDELLEIALDLDFPVQISRFHLLYAKVFFDGGDIDRSNEYLAKSFHLLAQEEIKTYMYWQPPLMAWACQRALNLKLETDYINQFITLHYSALPMPDNNQDNWPWYFQIKTLGGFGISSDAVNLHQSAKSSSKTLNILRVLTIAPNNKMSVSALKARLYPDSTDERAAQLLDIHIHRLRKYLGIERAILRQEDHVTLDHKYFHIDSNELEKISKIKINAENAHSLANRVDRLYQGEFLPEEVEDHSVIAARERYRNIYLTILFRCIDKLQDSAAIAIEICQNALVKEPFSEPLYRKLIGIYVSNGDNDMAQTTLNHCRQVMQQCFDKDVSKETLSLLDFEPINDD